MATIVPKKMERDSAGLPDGLAWWAPACSECGCPASSSDDACANCGEKFEKEESECA